MLGAISALAFRGLTRVPAEAVRGPGAYRRLDASGHSRVGALQLDLIEVLARARGALAVVEELEDEGEAQPRVAAGAVRVIRTELRRGRDRAREELIHVAVDNVHTERRVAHIQVCNSDAFRVSETEVRQIEKVSLSYDSQRR